MENEKLILERLYDAPLDKVWRALTDIAQMQQWFFPMMDEFEPTVGFSTHFDVTHNGKTYPHLITVTESVPMRKIAYSWKYGGYPGNSVVSFEIEAVSAEQTKLTLVHVITESFEADRYPDLSQDNFKAGWTHFADSLKNFVGRKNS